ncbi:MAG TPA: glycosyltransferase [Caulobacteraceae bacterium]
MRVAIPCKFVNLSGALFRFERVGLELARRGHELAFVALSGDTNARRPTAFPVLTLAEAEHQAWDVVMLPGAGFPETMFDDLRKLRRENFGVRLQHVLNDRTRAGAFLRVNRLFEPHRVVFNNRHWRPGDFTDFQAETFHFLEGAVDTGLFKPVRGKRSNISVIGGLSSKNPALVIEAGALLGMKVRLFGSGERLPAPLPAHVEWVGPLADDELPAFYRSVDVVVHTEEYAGWANLVAEAMASGVPVVCTEHGTLAMAEDGKTALVLQVPAPDAIAHAVARLKNEAGLASKLAAGGIRRIEAFDWSSYVDQLISLCSRPEYADYLWAPEWGLHGKWPLQIRTRGLDPVLNRVGGASVLDLGCAEGFVARLCLERGAICAHGVELMPTRTAQARRLCAGLAGAAFWSASLARWDEVIRNGAEVMLPSYDVVLYLGVHHHLPVHTRLQILDRVIGVTGRLLAIRVPENVFEDDALASRIEESGLRLIGPAIPAARAGSLRIYERIE